MEAAGPAVVASGPTAKIVLLGDTGVGKSSLVLRFINKGFDKYLESTIGASFMATSVDVDGRKINFQLWDTAGQEQYHGLAPLYYRKSAGAIVVFDITRRVSFEGVQRWVAELKEVVPDDIVVCVCGNKTDMESARQVSATEARQFAESVGALYFETSAKARDGLPAIQAMFVELARALPGGLLDYAPGAAAADEDALPDLRKKSKVKAASGGCGC